MIYKEIIEQISQMPAFIPLLGITVLELEPGYCKGELKLRPELNNPLGMVHGGCIFSLADTIGGLAAVSRNPDARVVTLNSNINFLRPAENTAKLIAEGREIKYGSKIGVYEVHITNEEGVLISHTVTNYFLAI